LANRFSAVEIITEFRRLLPSLLPKGLLAEVKEHGEQIKVAACYLSKTGVDFTC
jgi:hypothetical protein